MSKTQKTIIPAEKIAAICHEANAAYCRAIGDDTQPTWADAPEWQKESILEGVTKFLTEYAKNGRPLGPEGMHDGWMETKLRFGWTYGEVKDVEAKTHPCLLPYDSLPDREKAKDFLFGAIVFSMMDEEGD